MDRQKSNKTYRGKILISFVCLFFYSLTIGAQIRGKINQILEQADTLLSHNDQQYLNSATDTGYIKHLEQLVKEAEQKEASLQLELAQLRLQDILQDSVKRAQQYAQIDSLRRTTPGIPLVIDNDTLFYFYAARGGITPQMRADNTR